MVEITVETAISTFGHASIKMEHCTICSYWLFRFETDTQTSTRKRLMFRC
ncbi:TPA: hypothetical protein N0F65_011108 [Lagenidium giganteum]|uniref:Uncharacterized protein n=1 Tax=Lagenidium giganteum TaxID=4803 RepID=A0AAV2ZFC8_9STRA|nr:TPA: hypothetical protein N0F65_011108 [Lagenidium giganteum]